MTCAEVRENLGAYVDGELSPDDAMTLADHLTTCAGCAAEYETMLTTVRTVREGLERHRAPDVLRARIRASLREETGKDAPPSVARAAPATVRRWGISRSAVAAALIVAVASSGLTFVATNNRAGDAPVASEVLASHIRSLMPEHLTDVRSNDQHNVKPWFNGKMDFSPVVPRLEEQGFPLIGGRVDYVHGRPVAVVTYGRRQHIINVFSWPDASKSEAAMSEQARNGYNLLHWQRQGVEYWAASDLNVPELRQFVALLK